MGKSKWKKMIYDLKKETKIFINNYGRTIDGSAEWMIEFIVRNFTNFMMRNKSHHDHFTFDLSKLHSLNEEIIQDNKIFFSYRRFMDRAFIMDLIILNAKVLRIELEKSLTDGRYRFPRCSHFEMKVKHSLFVQACYYLESTEKDYLRFLICDDCEYYFDFCDKFSAEFWDEFGGGGKKGRHFETILGFMYITPLNFSMY